MTVAPRIGITTHGRNEKNQFYVSANYVSAVRKAGGIPFLLSPWAQEDGACLQALDGLVFTGGSDIEPIHYGGCLHPTICIIDQERDASELMLAKQAIARQLPTLAICRGAQLINVIEGGSLYEHLPEAIGMSVLHSTSDHNPISHPIKVEENTLLAKLMGVNNFAATSYHHQCVRRLANSLIPTAYAPDGIIEAMEMPSHYWLIGVQWHPEMTAADDPLQQRLFDGLIQAAAQKRA